MSRATERRLMHLERAMGPALPSRALTVVAADREEADRRLADLVTAGQPVGHAPLIILTGVPRAQGSLSA